MSHKITQKPVIIFDLDGTLLNIDERWYALHTYLAEKYKFSPVEKKHYISMKKQGIEEKDIVKNHIPENTLNDYLVERVGLIEDPAFLEKDFVKDDVTGLLSELSKKYFLILLTKRKHKDSALKEIQKLKIDIYFEKIFVTTSKSKDNFLQERLSDFPSKPVYIIGDTQDDFDAAKKNNISAILVADGSRTKDFLTRLKPDYLFDTITDVLTVI